MAETLVVREAAELGKNYGAACGSWVTDGNTDTATYLHLLTIIDNGELDVPAPLSGEWADGYTLGRLSEELGVDEESDGFSDLCTAFEDAYHDAYYAEVERSCRYQLDEGSE